MRIRLCVLITGLLAGCGGRQVVAPLTLPPRSEAMGEAQRVMLLPFSGPRGDEARRRIASLIVRGKLHRVVDQSNQRLRAAETEKQVQSGAVAVKGGSGATVMVAGETRRDDYQSNIEQGTSRRCTRWNKKRKCTKYVKIPIYTRKESCRVEVTGKVTRVADGQVLVQRDFVASDGMSKSREKKHPPSNQRALCNAVARTAIDKFAGFITPMKQRIALDFHEVSDGAGRTEKAIKLVQRSKLKKARTLFEAVVVDPALEPESRAWARYNLAVVLWAQAAFPACIEQLDQAEESLSDSKITQMRTACSEYLQ